jgi:Protein of unknown function (DUF3800)
VKLNLRQPANAKRRKSAVRFQMCELALDSSTATVEVTPPLSVTSDARKEPAANGDREDRLLSLDAAKRDDRLAIALLALGINAVVVIALVHGARFRLKTASAECVEERSNEVGFLTTRRLYLPCKRQTCFGTDRKVELVAVEAATFASRDSGAMPPRSIGVAEPLALAPAFGDVPLAIGVGGQIACVNGYVFSQVGMLSAKRSGASVETRRKRWSVASELAGEAVHRPHTRRMPECHLKAWMLRDQRRYPRPRRETDQAFDKASADESAGTVALATRPAERVKLRDQRGYLRRVEKFRDVADNRATRYLSRCHGSYPSCGHGPGSSSFAGPLFAVFPGKSLTRASDGNGRPQVACYPEKSLQRGTCLTGPFCYTAGTTGSCRRVVRKGHSAGPTATSVAVVVLRDTFVSVRVSYVDDAGDPETLPSAISPLPPVFVLAAVSFEQRRLHRVTMEYLALKRQHFPGLAPRSGHLLDWGRVEIKGAEIRKMARSGRSERRHALFFMDDVLTLLEAHDAKIFGRVWVKAIGTPVNREAMTTVSVQATCETYQDLLRDCGEDGLMVIDSSSPRLNAALSHSVFTQKYKATGDSYDRVLEMPVFGHSENHAGLQLADLVGSAFLYPMATHAYCTGHVTSVHVDPRFSEIRRQFAQRLKAIQYRYYDANGHRKGGITVSDALTCRPGSVLFQ